MRRHNGHRPVNKTDGPKKLGKRALVKSRRNDKKQIIQDGVRMMENDESCKKCEARIAREADSEGYRGNLHDSYFEGYHVC